MGLFLKHTGLLRGSNGLFFRGNILEFTTIKYGLLYNWWAWQGTGSGSITSSDNWRIATSPDYENLALYIDPNAELQWINNVGASLKTVGTEFWSEDLGATDSVGFHAIGSGKRGNSTTQLKDSWNAWAPIPIHNDVSTVYLISAHNYFYCSQYGHGWNEAQKYWGHSIRLRRLTTSLLEGEVGVYIGNDEKEYPTKCINGIEWLTNNLAETKYRNGDIIPYHGVGTDFYTDVEWLELTTGACCPPNGDWNNV